MFRLHISESYGAMFTLGVRARCLSTILAERKCEHTFFQVLTPEQGENSCAWVQGLDQSTIKCPSTRYLEYSYPVSKLFCTNARVLSVNTA